MARLLRFLNQVEAALAALAYVLVTALLLAGIAARELFGTTIWGSEKMAVFAAIYAAFLGMSLAAAANAHLRPQFTDGWWPEGWQPGVGRAGNAISCLLYVAIGVLAARFVVESYHFDARAMVLYWPLWAIQIVIPYAMFSSAFRYLVFALNPELKPRPALAV